MTKLMRFPRLWKRALFSIKNHHLMRNSFFLMATTALNSAIGFVYWLLADRVFSVAGVGVATATLSAITLAGSLGELGFGPTIVRRLPSIVDDIQWSRTWNAGLVATVVGGSLIAAGTVLTLPVLSARFQEVRSNPLVEGLVLCGVVSQAVSNYLDYSFEAHRLNEVTLLRNGVFAISKVTLLVVAIALAVSPTVGILSTWIVCLVVVNLWSILGLIRRMPRQHVWAISEMYAVLRSLWRQGILNCLVGIGGASIPYLMPVVVVTSISASAGARFYTAWLFANLLLIVSPAVAGSVLTEGAHDPDSILRQMRRGGLIVVIILGAGIGGVFVMGRPVLGLLGHGYESATWHLVLIFCLVVWPDALTNLYTSYLRIIGHEQHAALMNVVMAATAILIGIWLCHSIGVDGAAWAWLIGEIVGCLIAGLHWSLTGGGAARRVPKHRRRRFQGPSMP